jgi:hypothetical protein
LCQKNFQTVRLLREHGRRHGKYDCLKLNNDILVKNYKCQLCDMTVETPSDLRNHVKKRHSQQRDFECEQCHKL